MENIENLVLVSEAAKMLGLTPQRIGTFCRQGRFKGAKRIGYYWVIPKESVLSFVRQPHGTPKRKSNKSLVNDFLQQVRGENHDEQ